jgi:hypothetical protein
MLLEEVDGPCRLPAVESLACRNYFAGSLEDIHLLFQRLAEQGMVNADPLVGDLGVHRVAVPEQNGLGGMMTTAQPGSNDVAKALIDGALASFRSNKGWADKAVAQLPDDMLHVALDPNTNCIAVIMKHVAGNLLSRWTDFLTTDGEKPWRNRDDEFVDTFTAHDELFAYWDSGWQRLFDSLSALSADDLGKNVTIRGEPHTVPLAIQRSLAHCGYHVGQIILIARILAGDNWTTITIPRGASADFNQRVWGTGQR